MSASTLPEADVTRDVILGGRVVLWQPSKGYRVGLDAVLLAASVDAKPGARVLDLGCGVGAVALCLLARCPTLSVTGLEISSRMVELARRNALENGQSGRFCVASGSTAEPPCDISPGAFDHVVSNPPYMAAGTTAPSPDPDKRSAHVEDTADLRTWIGAAARFLTPRGRVTMIHRTDRLDHVLAEMRRSFGGFVVHPLWPRAGQSSKRVIVQARKGSAAPTRLEAGTILHETDGTFTPDVERALSGGSLPVINTL